MESFALDVDWSEEIIGLVKPVIHDGYLHFTGKPGLVIDPGANVARCHLVVGETWFDSYACRFGHLRRQELRSLR